MKLTREDFQQRLLPILTSQVIGLLCGILGVRLASRLIAPADYGLYGVFVSLTPVGASVIYIGLVKYVSRHWQDSPDRGGLLRGVLARVFRRSPWLLAAALGLALLTAPAHWVGVGILLFAAALLLSLTQLAQSALQAMRAHWRDCGVSAGISLARSFTPPLLYALSGVGFLALPAGFALHALLGTLLAWISLRPWWRSPAGAPAAPGFAAVYEGPQFVVLAVAGWLMAGSNRWLVAWCFGPEAAGYFTLAGNIGIILPAMLGLVLQQYFQPGWFESGATDPAGVARRIDRVAAGYTVAALGLALALHLAMPLLVGPLVGPRYAAAAQYVLMTGCFSAALTVANFYHVLLLAARKESACLTADLAGALILLAGGAVSAGLGADAFRTWLVLSPVVPWAVNRTLARRALQAAA